MCAWVVSCRRCGTLRRVEAQGRKDAEKAFLHVGFRPVGGTWFCSSCLTGMPVEELNRRLNVGKGV